MELSVISSPNRTALEAEFTELMKNASHIDGGVVSIVPDQSSFSEEERLIDIFKVTGLGNPEVLSFKRLFFKLRDKFPSGKRRLTAAAREMAVMYAIKNIKEEDFRLFKGVVQKSRLSGAISGLITGFKRYGVDEAALKKAEDGLSPSPLKNKIHDCLLTLESYNRLMENSALADADDDLWELRRILSLKECSFFEGKTVFIRHFSDLNKLQRQCVGQICARARAVYVGVIWEDKPEFATAKTLIDGMRRTAEEFALPFSHRILPPAADSRPAPLAYAAENYYNDFAAPFEESVGNSLYMHVSKNPFAEVQHVAASIARLVSRGVRQRDITVAARNAEDYSGYVKRIFPTYGISVFMDGKRPLSRHSVSRFLISAAELAIYGFNHENVFSFAKNPFAPRGGNCGELEDYCLEAGVRSWNWGEDFTFVRGSYAAVEYGKEAATEKLEDINKLRREIYELIAPLRKGFKEERTGKEYAQLLYGFITAAALPEKINAAVKVQQDNGDERGGEETRQVYNLLVEILEDIYTDFGELTLSPREFLDAFKTACGSVQVGAIPAASDSVIFGDIERMKGSRDSYVFLLGLNEDIFPRAFADTSVFTEYEAEILAHDWGIELPPMGGEKSDNEKLLVYEAISAANNALYMSYPISSSQGGNLRPSSIAERMRNLFPNIHETEDVNTSHAEYLCATKQAAYTELFTAENRGENMKFWGLIRAILEKDEKYKERLKLIDKSRNYSCEKTENLDTELLQKVLGEELYLSPSRLDSYGECPFSFFLQNILKLEDSGEMNISFADSGNLMHNIIDGFCAAVTEKKGGWAGVTGESADEIFNKVCAEIRSGINPHILSDPRFSAALERIEKFAKKSIDEIRQQLEEELFVPTGNEVMIGDNGTIPPTKIVMPNGKKVKFTGRIDRADIRTGVKITENGQTKFVDLVRIIDYKSSKRDIDFNKVLNGIQLQLFAYMDSYTQAKENARPAAALYFNLSETVQQAEIGVEETVKKDRLTGVGVRGRMAEREGITVLEAEEMDAVIKYARRAMVKAAEKIYRGEVPVSPVKTDSSFKCDYCGFKGVCRAEEIPQSCIRYLPKDKNGEALEAIKKEAAEIEA